MDMLGRICTHTVFYIIGAAIAYALFKDNVGTTYSVGVLTGLLIHIIVWSK